jgi:hypothetical protein
MAFEVKVSSKTPTTVSAEAQLPLTTLIKMIINHIDTDWWKKDPTLTDK